MGIPLLQQIALRDNEVAQKVRNLHGDLPLTKREISIY
jgi:hypothetical protein